MKHDELREARLAKGLTLAESAAALGLSVSQVSRIERGQRQAGPAELARFAALYRREDAPRPATAPALVPVIAEAAAGRWWEDSVFSCSVPVPAAPAQGEPEGQFALRVADAHAGAFRFHEGDFAICAPLRRALAPGDLVAVQRRRAGLVETSLRLAAPVPEGLELRGGAPALVPIRPGSAAASEGALEGVVLLGLVIARYAPVGDTAPL